LRSEKLYLKGNCINTMFTDQISIFVENMEGRLAEVTAILRNAGINIKAFSLADTTDYGVFRLIVNDTDKTENALTKEGFRVGITKVIAVEVMDEPGGLNQILDPLSQNEINVEYMYAVSKPKNDNAVLIFRFNDYDKALSIFKEHQIRVIPQEELF
jgi:hypothetical protein